MIRVGVIRGGVSDEYDASLATGAAVLSALREHFPATYHAVDVLITRDGVWHIAGRPITTSHLKDSVDVVFNALHGSYGEDGQVQSQLESLGIPYTGSGPVASSLGFNKNLLKDISRKNNITTPSELIIPDHRKFPTILPEVYFKEASQDVFLKFSPPWIVAPIGAYARAGFSVAKTREELVNAIRTASLYSGDVIVEEYIYGKTASVFVTDNFRNKEVYTFLPAERSPSNGTFLPHQKEALERIARDMYRHLGLRHYAQMDFVVTPKHVFFSDVRTLPSMVADSHAVRSIEAVGSHLHEFVDHVLKLALKGQSVS